jgi:murein DD-endopeptidase MepM/ murein hydrolase activator NlpD
VTYNGLFAANAIILAVLWVTGFVFFIHRAHAAGIVSTDISKPKSEKAISATPTGQPGSTAPKSKISVLGLAFGIKESKRYEEVVLPKNTQMMPVLQASKNIDPQAKSGAAVLVVGDSALSGENFGANGSIDADSSSVPTSNQISVYVVRPGDTLEQIALMFDVNVSTIRIANDLTPTEKIKPDQTLVILPVAGIKVTTKVKGDTITQIAKKYGADAAKVADFNNIPVNQALAANVSIIIPDAEDSIGLGHSDTKKPIATKPKTKTIVKTSGAGYFSCPVKGAVMTQNVHGNNGVDLAAGLGSPIYAAADGQVIIARAGGWGGGYGTYAVIKHSNGMQTLYGHMSSLGVSVGEQVAKGQKIGGMGNTGDSRGVHLHWEVRGGSNTACNGLKKIY